MSVVLLGTASVGDGNSGTFYWDYSETNAADGFNYISSANTAYASSGRWVRFIVSDSSIVQVATNIAQLVSTAAFTNLSTVQVLGYYAAGDGGGGTYFLTNTVVGTNAYGGRLVALGGTKSWQLVPTSGDVNPRQFGAVGDAVTDDEPRLRACSDWVSAGNASVLKLTKGEFLVGRSWQLGDNIKIEGSPDHWIVRGFTNLYQPYATVRNITFYFNTTNPVTAIPANNTNMVINGLRIRPQSTNATGQGLALYGVHNVVVKGLTIQRTFGDWSTAFMGKNLRLSDILVMSNAALFEDGIHIAGGENIAVVNCNINAGDDATAVGEDGADVYCQDVTFDNITCFSEKGYAIKVFASAIQTAGSTFIQRIAYNNIVGSTGNSRNGGAYVAEYGTPRGAITNLAINNYRGIVNRGGSSHDGVQAFGMYFRGCSDVTVSASKAFGARQYPLYIDTPKGKYTFSNCDFDRPNPGAGDSVQLYAFAGNEITFNNCTFQGSSTNAIYAVEANLQLVGGSITYTNQGIAFSQAVQSTRTLITRGVTFNGTGIVPVRSVGANGFLKRFEAFANIYTTSSAFSGSPEFGPGVFIFGNTGLSEQSRITAGGGNGSYIFTDGTSGHSTVQIVAGNANDRTLTLQNGNIDATVASTTSPTNLVIQGGGGYIQLGGSGAAVNGVAIGAGTPIASAALSVHSTTQGFLILAMTKAQRDAISSPSNGLMIYQSDGGNYGPRWYSTTLAGWMKADGTADP
jgi:hypothetical protein